MKNDTVDFKFKRDWIHAGVPYATDATTLLTAAKAEKLAALGAGEVVKVAPKQPPAAKD